MPAPRVCPHPATTPPLRSEPRHFSRRELAAVIAVTATEAGPARVVFREPGRSRRHRRRGHGGRWRETNGGLEEERPGTDPDVWGRSPPGGGGATWPASDRPHAAHGGGMVPDA